MGRRTGGQTDMTKLKVAFRNFAKEPDSKSERRDSVLHSEEKTCITWEQDGKVSTWTAEEDNSTSTEETA
jgi:hypothetical protein